ncbi:TIGR01777 family protein [Mucilaginibacter sp. PPCGB 2223]|uniref:TIGR01777 family oxidoreductase n=1 Tax=Mucilaginibacter sp. PPCGB 2223 TaxID=1886027 RepID=UPI000824D46E|nr:TIGR01777 family oxidoreductase [Mucilaginibacter sp. PPCGB 2223]OCX52402.1 TIGR01777 family protein [Mucilaginibacter sp. PPCGB 2223]
MSKHILITGGTGILGRNLTQTLLQKGFTVSHLSRKPGKNPDVKTYLWNVEQGVIHPDCITGVDTIVHLAGEGIADKRWTDERKKVLIESRTKSIELIYSLLRANPGHQVKNVISASGVGYYGNSGEELMYEDNIPSQSFLGECCVLWEKAVDKGLELDMRVVKFRTGVVLTLDGGALPQIAAPIKLGVGSPLGDGLQWVPWIHIQDAIGMYLMAIENEELQGVYNMVAPNAVTNKQLTQAIAQQLHKVLWAPNVPAWLLKLLFGEMSTVILGSTKVSAARIQIAGYKFLYEKAGDALEALYGPPKILQEELIPEKQPEEN